jgi:hypothetical protein
MSVLRNDNRWGRSNVAFRADGSIEYNKDSSRCDLSHIDFGLSVLSGEVLRHYPGSVHLDLADVWRDLSGRGQLAAFEVGGRFYEIGSTAGLADTEAFLTRRLQTA